jgi:hypothetical protein
MTAVISNSMTFQSTVYMLCLIANVILWSLVF